MKRRKFLAAVAAGVAVVSMAFVLPSEPFVLKTSGYKILTDTVPEAQRPWRSKIAPYVDTGLHDSAGVRMFKWNGIIYNHPVAQAQYGLQNLAAYRKTGDVFYLKRSKAQAERLLIRRVATRGGYYYPYPFDFTHNVHTGIIMKAPWYSGMAQGETLSLLVQLSMHPSVASADRTRYRDAAHYTMVTLLRSNIYKPWVVNRDSGGYYWIQEYPASGLAGSKSDYTYNGFMYAMLGMWDYYLMTRDPLVLRVWDASLTTIDKYFPNLRNIGQASDYCLTHGIPTPSYHDDHIALLTQLTWLSGNPRFKTYADQLRSDYP